MALILNIETATDVCSVALANEEGILDLIENTDGRSHASLLSVFTDDILKRNGLTMRKLDAVAISMGPGSYTGLRIGVSTSKGLCYGAGIPLIAVSTLQSMAMGMIRKIEEAQASTAEELWFCPMIDARRLEVYTAFFDRKAERKTDIRAIILTDKSFEEVLNERKIWFFGNGASKFSNLITHPNALFSSEFRISARDMTELSQHCFNQKDFKDVAYFEPFYLKDFVATTPKNKVLQQ